MNDQQINTAIAGVCGWTEVREGKLIPGGLVGLPPSKDPDNRGRVPNYCADLNAMHEAEEILQNQFKLDWSFYWQHLSYVEPHPIFATARQRAEAFLRTLNLWRDDTTERKETK